MIIRYLKNNLRAVPTNTITNELYNEKHNTNTEPANCTWRIIDHTNKPINPHNYTNFQELLEDAEKTPPPPLTYYLQNLTAGYIGNSPLFWHKDNNSYTQWINEAKQFTQEEAEQIVITTIGTHKWRIWPTTLIHKKTKQTIDIQDLPPQEQIDDIKNWIHGPQPALK